MLAYAANYLVIHSCNVCIDDERVRNSSFTFLELLWCLVWLLYEVREKTVSMLNLAVIKDPVQAFQVVAS